MARQPGPKGRIDSDPKARQEQRAAALRANLAKRKQQAGARRGGKAVGKSRAIGVRHAHQRDGLAPSQDPSCL
jgi:hypothetical protein